MFRSHLVLTGRATLLPLVAVLVLGPVSSALAKGCDDVLDQAKEHYSFGRFEEAIDLLGNCVGDPGGDPETLREAYRVIGMAYVAMSKELEAKQAIRDLLDIVPEYEPDPENDRPGYVELVREVKRENDPDYVAPGEEPEQKGGMLKWIAGGVAAVVAVVLLGGGGDDDPAPNGDLPDPPGLPGKEVAR